MRYQIKKFFLELFYKKEIKNRLKKKFNKISKNKPSIAVIVDSGLNLEVNDFSFLSEIMNVSKHNIYFLWYKSLYVYHDSNHLGINIDDISLTGKVNEEYALFFNRKYDVLINLYQNNSIFIRSLSLKVNNVFSIGFTPVDLQLNDIIFDFNPKEIDILKRELNKYTKIIFK
tara:strand:+ start:40 stop:555 length:516 start_codon:yes stop_codon:yes gene_type:complete